MREQRDEYCYYPEHRNWLGMSRKERRVVGHCNVAWELTQVHDLPYGGHSSGRPYCKEHGGPEAGCSGDWCLWCEKQRDLALSYVQAWRKKNYQEALGVMRPDKALLLFWDGMAILSLFPDADTRSVVWRELEAVGEYAGTASHPFLEDLPPVGNVGPILKNPIWTTLDVLRHWEPERFNRFLERVTEDPKSRWRYWVEEYIFTSHPERVFPYYSAKLLELDGIDEIHNRVRGLAREPVKSIVRNDPRLGEFFAHFLFKPIKDWESECLVGWDDVYHAFKLNLLSGLEQPIPNTSLGRAFCRTFYDRAVREDLFSHESWMVRKLTSLILEECRNCLG